jgi:hypothetical protein
MKSSIKSLGLALGVIFLSLASAQAQTPNTGRTGRMYDPATETTLKGTVEAVTQGASGQMTGTHLTLKADNETREVMLGPSKFISSKGFSFAKGDSIEATGF